MLSPTGNAVRTGQVAERTMPALVNTPPVVKAPGRRRGGRSGDLLAGAA
jgi:hypothetical protein